MGVGGGGEKRKRKAIIRSGDGGGDRNDFNSEEKKVSWRRGINWAFSFATFKEIRNTRVKVRWLYTHAVFGESKPLYRCIDYPLGFATTLGGRQSPYHDPFFFTMGKPSHVSEHQEGDACLPTLTGPSLLRHLQGKGHTYPSYRDRLSALWN